MQRIPSSRFEARLKDGRRLWLERRPFSESAALIAAVGVSRVASADALDQCAPDRADGVVWKAYTEDETGVVLMGVGILCDRHADTAMALLVVADGHQRAVLGELLLGTLQLSALDLGVSRVLVRVAPDDALVSALLAGFGAVTRRETDRFRLLELQLTTPHRTLKSSGGWPRLTPGRRPAA